MTTTDDALLIYTDPTGHRVLEVFENPLDVLLSSYSGRNVFTPEVNNTLIPVAFARALVLLVEDFNDARCHKCEAPVGHHLSGDQDETQTWHPAYIYEAVHMAGTRYLRLCESCSPPDANRS